MGPYKPKSSSINKTIWNTKTKYHTNLLLHLTLRMYIKITSSIDKIIASNHKHSYISLIWGLGLIKETFFFVFYWLFWGYNDIMITYNEFATFLISICCKSCKILYNDISKCNYIKTVKKEINSCRTKLDNNICRYN